MGQGKRQNQMRDSETVAILATLGIVLLLLVVLVRKYFFADF